MRDAERAQEGKTEQLEATGSKHRASGRDARQVHLANDLMRNDNHMVQLWLFLEKQFNSIWSWTISPLKSCRRDAAERQENSDRRCQKIKLQTPRKTTVNAYHYKTCLWCAPVGLAALSVFHYSTCGENRQTLLIFANKQTSGAFFFFDATTLNGKVIIFCRCISKGFGDEGIKDRAHFGISVSKSDTLSGLKHNLIILRWQSWSLHTCSEFPL